MPKGQNFDGQQDGEDARSNFVRRLSGFFLKPVDPSNAPHAEVAAPPTAEELEFANRYATDKERIIGLLAAPVAALIGILIIGALLANDPAALLKDGQVNKLHVSPSLYLELLGVLVVLAAVMLGTAWFRKRLYLGIAMALYGLAVFNLHYWGFGVPYLMVGAWLLVRAYRAQRDVREASGTGGSGGRREGTRSPGSSGPRASKRYTPPTSRPRPSQLPKPEGEEREAG
ncbi:MAG: hypothetical protein ACYDHU_05975 [Acidimicrobiales bacterium]